MRGKRIVIPLPNTGAAYRRRNTHNTKAFLVILFLLFVAIQFDVFNYFLDLEDNSLNDITNDSNAAVLSMVPSVLLALKFKNFTNGYNSTQNGIFDLYSNQNISEMKRLIAKYNDLQTVLNEDIYGPLQNDSVIIVIQVHTRIEYLRYLIESLSLADNIAKSLLVFSHDYYREDINKLVENVNFSKVIQIFYPYSIQTHPNEFPGTDPSDCNRNFKKEEALINGCNNALYPDLYGHYREAQYTQTKHHWWWKANRVINQLNITRHHNGLFLFIEEDHYLAEDFLHVLDLMQKYALEFCGKCNIFSLGTYLKAYYNIKTKKKGYYGQYIAESTSHRLLGYKGGAIKKTDVKAAEKNLYQHSWSYRILPSLYSIYQKEKIEVTPWISSQHNMGFALNRSTWNLISKKCAEHFCTYDDYNWDWSLQHVFQQCLRNKLFAMVIKGPRIFHIGECGVHHKKKICDSNETVAKIQEILRKSKKENLLFPKSLTPNKGTLLKKINLKKGNGGWGDKRDHFLCLNMTASDR